MTDPAPKRIWAWPFDNWYRGGSSTHKVKVAGAKDVEYVRADIITTLEAENARLREALESIAKDDHVQGWKTKPGIIARAALEQKGSE